MKIKIIGVPFNGDGTPPEVENPAQSLRDEGMISLLQNKGHHLTDFGDLRIPKFSNKKDPITNVLNFDAWREVSLSLSKTLGDELAQDSFPIVLGGDCAILMGIFDAFNVMNQPVNLFFLDGHADFHTLDTSTTGEPADLELAALTGHLSKEIVYMTGRGPLLHEENVIAYGIGELDSIERSNIMFIERKSILKDGIEPTFRRSLGAFQNPGLPLWLHFDVDVLDKEIMPAIQYPVEGGLSYNEIQELLTLIKERNQLIGMSITCYHPRLDYDKKGVKTLLLLFKEFF